MSLRGLFHDLGGQVEELHTKFGYALTGPLVIQFILRLKFSVGIHTTQD